MKLSLYVCHHKASRFLTGYGFRPIHVGKQNSFHDIGCSGDDKGEHISPRNPFYCELTAQYWIWKNDEESDVVGLMHYRRHFNFSERQDFSEDQWGCVPEEQIDDVYQDKFGLREEKVKACLGSADVILPRSWDVRSVGCKNIYDHYRAAPSLNISDYDEALKVLREKYPEFGSAADKYNRSCFGYFNNMYVMRRPLFDHYSKWLFSILFELEERIDLAGYDREQRRVFGHISERLLGIYFTKMLDDGEVKVNHAQRIFCQEGEFNGDIDPAFENDNVPIVICFDDFYVHAGGALLYSILVNSDKSRNYDILVLEDGISNKNMKSLDAMTARHDNVSIRFFDINAFSEIQGVHTRGHFSPATYARLFISKLFKRQRKVLFIDADTILNADPAPLLDIELGANLVAAVKDIVMEGFVRYGAPSDEHSGFLPAGRYLSEYLGLVEPDGYFQAGLIVFNLERMRDENVSSELMQVMDRKRYWFLDQDIMNVVFQQRVHYLPLKWNVFHGNGDVDAFFPGLKFSTYMRYLEARNDPYMVHYAGENKPWIQPNVDFSELYWACVAQTPWYEGCLQRTIHAKNGFHGVGRAPNASLESWFRGTMKRYLGGVLPVGTIRRRVASQVYLVLLAWWRRSREVIRRS